MGTEKCTWDCIILLFLCISGFSTMYMYYFYNWTFKKIKVLLRFVLCIDRTRKRKEYTESWYEKEEPRHRHYRSRNSKS